MTFPVRVTWKHHDPSPGVEDYINEQAAKLERVANDILDCHVTVETPHKHKASGNHFLVSVDVRTPGHEFVAKRDPREADSHTEVHATIKDAFESLKHQLEHHHGKRRDQQRQPRA
jgi:ribosome-associated translation inhibitor RaiA